MVVVRPSLRTDKFNIDNLDLPSVTREMPWLFPPLIVKKSFTKNSTKSSEIGQVFTALSRKWPTKILKIVALKTLGHFIISRTDYSAKRQL